MTPALNGVIGNSFPARFKFRNPNDGYAGRPGLVQRDLTIQQNRPAGLERQDASLDRGHGLNGSRPHGREIEPQILLRLRSLDHNRTVFGQIAAALDGSVGPFDGLDRHNHSILDYHTMSDIATTYV